MTSVCVYFCRRLCSDEVWRGDLNAVQDLLDRGVNPDTFRFSGWDDAAALHMAVQRGFIPIVEALLDAGADINVKTSKGMTPLYIAAEVNSVEAVKTLIERGCDINMQAYCRTPPLGIACHENNKEAAQILLEAGADINICTQFGSSPLHNACIAGNLNLVQSLLPRGADLHRKDTFGHTPFHEAVIKGHIDLVEYLLVEWDTQVYFQNGVVQIKSKHHQGQMAENPEILVYLDRLARDGIPKPGQGNTLCYLITISS